MSLQQRIESILAEALSPVHLEVHNESHMHGGPATESHYKVVAVASEFEGKRLLARHRLINQLLAAELAGPIHALAIHTYTPAEWADQKAAPTSPTCRGGDSR